jgi:hypothetical protein
LTSEGAARRSRWLARTLAPFLPRFESVEYPPFLAASFYVGVRRGRVAESRTQDRIRPIYVDGRTDRAPFALAWILEWWQSPEGAEIESCNVLSTSANTW